MGNKSKKSQENSNWLKTKVNNRTFFRSRTSPLRRKATQENRLACQHWISPFKNLIFESRKKSGRKTASGSSMEKNEWPKMSVNKRWGIRSRGRWWWTPSILGSRYNSSANSSMCTAEPDSKPKINYSSGTDSKRGSQTKCTNLNN